MYVRLILTLVICCWISAEEDSFVLKCLTLEEAQKAIVDDSLEPYFETLQPMEMTAKTGSPITGDDLASQREECRKRYIAGARAITEEEQEAFRGFVKSIHPVLQKHYPKLAAVPWKFLKMVNNIEGGLPHTRGDCIVFSEAQCERFVFMHKRGGDNMVMQAALITLLLHEQIHVYQRTHQGAFDKLYTDVWGFKKLKEIKTCPWLVKHHLSNPDGVECLWVLPNGENKYLWPLVVFRESEKPIKHMPMDFSMLAIDVEVKDGVASVIAEGDDQPRSINLMMSPNFRQLFPMSGNVYHPNEASADMFPKLFVFDHIISKAQPIPEQQVEQVNKVLGPLRAWFKEHFKQDLKQQSE